MRRLLDAEVLEDRHARRGGDAPGGRPHERLRRRRRSRGELARRRPARTRRRQLVETRRRARRASRWSTRSSSTRTASSAARHQASVPGRTWRWMSASSAVSVRRGIDDDQRAVRVVGDLLELGAGAREAVRLPRVLADEHRDLGVLVVAGRVARGLPNSWPSTQNSPVFSWASAFERYRRPERGARRRRRSRRRGGSPGRRRRSRRSTRRRGCRGPRRSARRPRRSPCPSRSPRTCRRRGGAAGVVSRWRPFW